MSTSIKPLADRLVAVREKAEDRTASGLYIPDAAKQKPVIANVLAIGKDVKEVKVGDRIIFDELKPIELKNDGQEFLILKEEDVLATLAK